MYSTPRTMLTGRIPEYLENLKAEFETLAHDVNMYKMQRDDYERKLQAQLQELSNIQQTLYDLERNHTKIKQQYEDEILRLRRQLEMSSGSTGNSTLPSNTASTYNRSVSPGVPPTGPGSQPPSLRDARSAPTVPLPGTSGPDKGPVGTGIFYPGGGLAPLDPSKRSGYPPVAPSPNAPPQAPIVKRPRDPQDYYAQQGPPQGFPGISSIQTPEPIKHKQDIPEEKPVAMPPAKVPSIDRERRVNTPTENGTTNNNNNQASKEVDKMNVDNPSGSDWIVGYNPGVQTNLNVELMHTLDHNSVVCCVKFSGDGKYMATGCNKSAQIYDIETGEKVHTFSEDIGKDGDLYIRSVCFSPDGRYLACGAEDKTVKLWDVEKGECLFTLGNEEVGPKDGVTSVAFSPDGRLVAAGSLDRIVRLWDAQTGYFLERYEGHMDSVYSVAFSPDGKSLASGSLDKTLKLWDLSGSRARSRCRSNFTGHKDFVLSVAFSPDGNWLISGSKDRSVQFWDPKSAVSHMMLQGHKNSVISVAVSPVGGYFATGSGDFRARIWKYE